MNFALSQEQEQICEAIGKICAKFDDAYWLKKDKEGCYPADFHRALADAYCSLEIARRHDMTPLWDPWWNPVWDAAAASGPVCGKTPSSFRMSKCQRIVPLFSLSSALRFWMSEIMFVQASGLGWQSARRCSKRVRP